MKSLIKSAYNPIAVGVILASALFLFANNALAYANPAVVNLGGAANFAVLSSTAITNTPASVITGDIGVSPAAATFITGFTCPAVTGTVHVVSAGGPTLACQTIDPAYLTPTVLEYEAAYSDAQGRTADATITTALDGLTYTPGVYSAANLDLNNGSSVTLDCSSNANGVFIFQTAGHLNVGTSAHVNIGSCNSGNIFWVVAGTTNILGGTGTESTFQGTVLGGQGTTEISLGVGSTILGRLMSDKTISLQGNIITVPTTPPVPGPIFIDLNTNGTLDSGEQSFTTIQAAITAATIGDKIILTSDITTTAQILINKALTIDGLGHTLFATITSGANSAITISANDVTIKNLVENGTGSTGIHGFNIYQASNVTLDAVTASNNNKSGITVNGSVVTVNNIKTAGNAWGGINVDLGSGVVGPATLTVNGTSAHTEVNADIWKDDNAKMNVTVVDTNHQYSNSTYTHDVSIVGTKYKLLVAEQTPPEEVDTTPAVPVPGGHRRNNNAATPSLPSQASPVAVGRVLGAFTGPDGSSETSLQIIAIKTQLVGLIRELIAMLQIQLQAAKDAGQY
ncbi:MAG: ice-binding family protein [Minisyncoccia bacterium]